MYNLGKLYLKGRGVARNDAKAREWYQKAVEGGSAEGMVRLGWLYSGSRDYAQALQWYQKAAEVGDPDAAVSAGRLYEKGPAMVRDYAQARRWYQKAAARRGYTEAKRALLRLRSK
jgi:uncharacterized protein